MASRILGDVKPRRPTLRPAPATPAPKRPRKALRSLDEASLALVVGGITAEDDWETPNAWAAESTWNDGGITATDDWEARK